MVIFIFNLFKIRLIKLIFKTTLIFSIQDCREFQKLILRAAQKKRLSEQIDNQGRIELERLAVAKNAFAYQETFNPHIEKKTGEYFESALKNTFDAYVKTKYYAPYSVLVQSSGFGKTRQLEILSRNDNYRVVYVNLNKQTSTSFPMRSNSIANILLCDEPRLGISQKNWITHVFYRFFKVHLEHFFQKGSKLPFTYYNDNVDDVSNRTGLPNLVTTLKKEIEKDLDFQNLEVYFKGSQKFTVLFVFDESRCLAETDTISKGKIF